jgi:hypothetical protein
MADQVIRSWRYCGVMGSSASVLTGRPRLVMSSSSRRAISRPSPTLKESSRYGSLINPFQPTVVRGFSK